MTKKISKSAQVDLGDKELVNLKSQLARTLADYDNLRKRVEVEKEVWTKFSGQRIAAKLIPVLDILESAQIHLSDQGLAIAIGEFKKVLDEEGLEEIRPKSGDKFDHNLHEVVETVGGGKYGEISEIVLPGWKFKNSLEQSDGLVVRIAKVKVFKEELKQ